MVEDSDAKLNSEEHEVVHHIAKVKAAKHTRPKRKITISFTPWQAISVILFVLLIGSLLTGGFGLFGPGATVLDNNNDPSAPARVDVSMDDDAVLGSADAPVTIIEFSDFQCPYCGRFWGQTLPDIEKNYIDTGKVKLVYRDFPLTSIHANALPAAVAAECVREQGGDEAFFKYHDKIFGGQSELSDAALRTWAKDIGFDINSCLDDNKYKDEVENDIADGSNAGVKGTPAFFVGNEQDGYVLVAGALPYSVFKQIIDAELGQ